MNRNAFTFSGISTKTRMATSTSMSKLLLIDYSFLQMTLPCDDIQKRADAAQRPNYRVSSNERLPSHIEFELSRLIEK